MKKSTRLLIGALTLAVLGGAYWLLGRDRDLSEPPPRGADATAKADTIPTSTITVTLRLTDEALTQIAAEGMPKSVEVPENRHVKTFELFGREVARISAHSRGTIGVSAPLKVTANGNGVTATTALTAAFTVFKGSTRETISGAANVSGTATLDIDTTWAPVARVELSHHWTQRPQATLFEIRRLGGIDISLGGVADEKIQPKLRAAEAAAENWLKSALDLRRPAETFWFAPASRRRLALGGGSWIHIDPIAAHFITPAADSGDLVLVFGLSTHLRIANDSGSIQSVSVLPPLQKTLPANPGIRLQVPVDVAYDAFSDALRKRKESGRARFASDLGETRVHVRDIEVYPSGAQLVFALDLSVDPPTSLLDTRGRLYLLGSPVYDARAQRLTVENLRFSRITDNTLVNLLTAALEAEILSALAPKAYLDLRERLGEARGRINGLINTLEDSLTAGRTIRDTSLARLLRFVDVRGAVDSVQAVTFRIGPSALRVEPTIAGHLAIDLRPPLIAPTAHARQGATHREPVAPVSAALAVTSRLGDVRAKPSTPR